MEIITQNDGATVAVQEKRELQEGFESDAEVKRSCIERLSDFFRVAPHALSKFNFDGKDNIKELTKALNSTSDVGTKAYYDIAIKIGKRDAGVAESTQELKEYGVYNSETDINSNPKTGENEPDKLVSFIGKVSERISAVVDQLKELQEMFKENDDISSEPINSSLAELESYMKSLEEESNIKDESGV